MILESMEFLTKKHYIRVKSDIEGIAMMKEHDSSVWSALQFDPIRERL